MYRTILLAPEISTQRDSTIIINYSFNCQSRSTAVSLADPLLAISRAAIADNRAKQEGP